MDTVFSQLVPVATNEIPLVDRLAGGNNTTVIRAGQGTVTENASGLDDQASLFTRRAIVPGTLVLNIAGSTYRDDNAGGLTLVSGAGGQQDSIVDYLSGRITLANSLTGSASWTYEPGAPVQMACDTGSRTHTTRTGRGDTRRMSRGTHGAERYEAHPSKQSGGGRAPRRRPRRRRTGKHMR